jgi:hypothetical protein
MARSLEILIRLSPVNKEKLIFLGKIFETSYSKTIQDLINDEIGRILESKDPKIIEKINSLKQENNVTK